MKVERYVVDTNVLISAAFSARTSPGLVVRHVLAHGHMLFSEATFAELDTRLWRPKFDRYLSIESRKRLLHDFRAVALWVDVPADVGARRFSRDPDDDKFLHVALAGGAAVVISGDHDLLDLEGVDGLRVVSPAQALAQITAAGGRG
jgi:putative PIN family toxin of toxin-antitoxin system